MAIVTLTNYNFEEKVLDSQLPVLIDFWAPWCAPCRMIGPVIEELGNELDGKVVVAKVNVDEQQELASQFRVSSIPTLAVVKNGEITATGVGFRSKADILKMLEN